MFLMIQEIYKSKFEEKILIFIFFKVYFILLLDIKIYNFLTFKITKNYSHNFNRINSQNNLHDSKIINLCTFKFIK